MITIKNYIFGGLAGFVLATGVAMTEIHLFAAMVLIVLGVNINIWAYVIKDKKGE